MYTAKLLAFASTTACLLPAQAFTWRLEDPNNSPSPRVSASMTHDYARGRTMLFGGSTGSTDLGDFWEWDGSSWAARFSVHYPQARRASAMSYDEVRQRIVLFGGLAGGSVLGDTWEFDGVDWAEVTPAVSPSSRRGHAMTYDVARQRIVLFGGFLGSGGLSNETWEWDGLSWVQRSSPQDPPARTAHAIAYDIARQRTVLYGGVAGSTQYEDTWEWDGVAWSLRAASTPSIPSGRRLHAMEYDRVRQRVVLFGGLNSLGTQGDTVEWDGVAWAIQVPAVSPPGRHSHAMAFDTTRQRMVLFGGSTSDDETWTRGQFATTATASQFGVGCSGSQLTLTPSAAGRPIIGQVASAIIDNATSPVAAVAIGWSRDSFGPFSLPVTLASVGMPGCDLLQSSDLLGLAATSTGPTTLLFEQPLPDDASLVGAMVYLQAYAFAPGANELEVVVSNGVEWFIGDL